eukprot:g3441.t1
MKYHHQWSPTDALLRACRTGNVDLMKTTLRKGADVNAVDDSAARQQASGGDLEGAAGADYFTTPLMLAASNGYLEIVDGLLKEGAQIEVQHTWCAHEYARPASSPRAVAEGLGSSSMGDMEIVDLDFDDDMKVRPYRTKFDDNENIRETRGDHRMPHHNDGIEENWGGPASPLPGELAAEQSGTTSIRLSAAVAAAAAGQLVILRKLVLEHGADVALECGFQYGDETPLLAAAHRLDGMGVPTAPLVIANHNLAFLYESLSHRGPKVLLEAASLYGKEYTQARRLFGSQDEISLTARGDWGACLLRITSSDDPGTGTPEAILASGLIGDERIPFPTDEKLYPPLEPFQDELAKMKEILLDLNEVILEDSRLLQQEGPEAENAVRKILISAVKKNWRALIYADVKWRVDRQVIVEAVRAHGRSIQAADIKFRDDYKIAEIAVTQDWLAFKYLTPRLKRKKKLFQIAKKSLVKTIAQGDWHALGQADSMLRGDPEVVEIANAISDEAAMCYVDRRILWSICISSCLATIAIVTWVLVFIVMVDVIWPPVQCQFSEVTMQNLTNDEGYKEEVEVYREWITTYEYGYECNRSLYTPPPEPKFEEIDDTTIENDRKEAEELIKEEMVKEEEEKSRRRLRSRRTLALERRKKRKSETAVAINE